MINLRSIASYILENRASGRSAFYRHRKDLNLNCSQIRLDIIPLTNDESQMASHLADFAPLEEIDFDRAHDIKIFRKLSKFSRDRAFFEMLLRQDRLWKSFSERSLMDFIKSNEGRDWYQKSKALKRRPRFQLEIPYYPTRGRSLMEEIHLKQILRENPLLRFLDLKAMGLRNVQPIMERFPHLNHHRERYLKRFAASLARSK